MMRIAHKAPHKDSRNLIQQDWRQNGHCRKCQYGELRHSPKCFWLYHHGALVGCVALQVCMDSQCAIPVWFQIWKDKKEQSRCEEILASLKNKNDPLPEDWEQYRLYGHQELSRYSSVLSEMGEAPDSITKHLLDKPPGHELLPEQEKDLVENDSKAVPLKYIQEVIDTMAYASVERVMFQMLHYTGCRLQELDKMKRKNLVNDTIYWQLGKNQGSCRKEKLPPEYVEELRVYHENSPVPGSKMFHIGGETLRRYFTHLRQRLSPAWRERRRVLTSTGFKTEYVLQLKGLRKNFQTIVYAEELRKWKDAGVALEFASKRMKHSSARITAYHYIQNFDALGINELGQIDIKKVLNDRSQKRLLDYSEPVPERKSRIVNPVADNTNATPPDYTEDSR